VSTEEILRQADFLKNLGKALNMSRTVWNAFSDAIRSRQQYADRSAKEDPQHKDNAGHVYFLDVLRRLVDILGKVVQVKTSASIATKPPMNETFVMSNMFEALNSD
jgi:hypothetical protein